MSETIALFGATGSTGKHFLAQALDAGYKVTILVRTPSKVTITNDNLTILQGDLSNAEDVKKTVEGATYVVSMAGGPLGKPKEYPKDSMLNFAKSLVAILKESKTIKVLFYQAGAFSALPNGDLPVMMKVMRTVIGSWVLGLEPNYMDNEAVIKYIGSIQGEIGFKTIVSRPGAIAENEGGATLAASPSPPFGPVSFKDLASFSLKALKDESLYGTYPFVK